MKKHTKNYLEAFYPDYEFDKPLCEVCGRIAVDIHHLDSGMKKRSDHPALLIGLCREHHTEYGDKKKYITFLIKIHKDFVIKRMGYIPKEYLNEFERISARSFED